MQITVDIPDDLSQRADPAREALEAFAIAGYRSGALTPRQTRELLGFETRFQLNEFLMEHDVWEGAYGIEEYRKDLAALDQHK
jgi:hypothetical protein